MRGGIEKASTSNDFRICSASGKKGTEVQSLTLNDFGWLVELRERAIERERGARKSQRDI